MSAAPHPATTKSSCLTPPVIEQSKLVACSLVFAGLLGAGVTVLCLSSLTPFAGMGTAMAAMGLFLLLMQTPALVMPQYFGEENYALRKASFGETVMIQGMSAFLIKLAVPFVVGVSVSFPLFLVVTAANVTASVFATGLVVEPIEERN